MKVIVGGVHETSYSSFKYVVTGMAYLRAIEPSEKVESGMVSIVAVTGVDTKQEGAISVEFRTVDDGYMYAGTSCEVYDGMCLAPEESRSMPGEHNVKPDAITPSQTGAAEEPTKALGLSSRSSSVGEVEVIACKVQGPREAGMQSALTTLHSVYSLHSLYPLHSSTSAGSV